MAFLRFPSQRESADETLRTCLLPPSSGTTPGVPASERSRLASFLALFSLSSFLWCFFSFSECFDAFLCFFVCVQV